MIYLTNRRYRTTVTAYLESERAQDLADRIHVIAYQDLPKMKRIPTGMVILADHERFTPAQWELARLVWNRLSQTGDRVRLFNDPRTVLTRGPLLTKMHAEGINSFRAVSATDPFDELRYPVFVREEADHTGSLTELIHDEATLESELKRLTSWRTKHRRADLLVIEFCDTKTADGWYPKYSAFRVGDAILPRYLTFSREWVVKTAGVGGDDWAIEAEYEYVTTNPHEDWLRKAFDLSGITFGRMDYGLLGDRPQVWEINTNATIGPMPPHRKKSVGPEMRVKKEPGRAVFHDAFRDLMRGLDMDPGDETVALDIPLGLRLRLATNEVVNDVRRMKSRLMRKIG